MMESEMEKYLWDIFKWKSPELLHAGMVKLEGMGAKLSKSKAQKEVASGEFTGWDDPRTWSVQSLRKRGFLPETLRKFVEDIGLNQNDTTVAVDILYSINRKFLHEIAEKANFVLSSRGKLIIVKEDATEIKIDSKISPKPNQIYHFLGLGYCRYDKDKKFYFAHP